MTTSRTPQDLLTSIIDAANELAIQAMNSETPTEPTPIPVEVPVETPTPPPVTTPGGPVTPTPETETPTSAGDGDPAHNTDDPTDMDPAHHAPGWKPPATTPVVVVALPGDETDAQPPEVKEELNEAFGVNTWLGAWSGNVRDAVHNEVTKSDDDVSVLIDYNQPFRDAGGYSAGGLSTLDEVDAWSKGAAAGIGDQPAWVILSPDAIGLMDNLSGEKQAAAWTALQISINNYQVAPLSRVYVDLSMWLDRDEAVRRIKNLHGMHGFSLNVSAFNTREQCHEFGDYVAQRTGLHYVIDTSRNGNGNPHAPAWCNVTRTMVGTRPTTTTGSEYCDALLWLKVPGQSDGRKINGYDGDGQQDRYDIPGAGEEWPEYRDAIFDGSAAAWDKFEQRYGVK